jgi:hypothetical protein
MPWYVAWAPTPWNGRLGCIYSPQHKTSYWRKVVLSVAHRLVQWCTGQCTVHCPMCLAVGLTPQATVGAQVFYTGHSGLHTRQSGGLLSSVPPRTILSSSNYSTKGVPFYPHGCIVIPSGHSTNRSLQRGT